ncbi:ATP-dependent DNA helicase RRM3 [Trifolium repens]|nr:ATP-dependent DNA helicase RRM3 [Trifolium repens]
MRTAEATTLLCSRRLFQQFLVDGFTMMEAERLSFVRNNQSTLRVSKYAKLNSAVDTAPKVGKRVVLPSSFVGSKRYMDQLYVSPSEACWRIFSFCIHARKPAVERLFYHLEGQNSVYFQDYENLDDVLLKPSVTESMFTSWFEANKIYPQGRDLTYGQFVSKFVYRKKERKWKPRKRGYTIGRLIWVPPSTGELYYFRMMLTVIKGGTCYDDLRKIGETQYFSYRDACFAMGFLEDDRVYITAIKEAKDWGSGHYLRRLFVIMLLANTMNRPNHVWTETKEWLSDGILYRQRIIANNRALRLSDDQVDNLTLIEIEKLLQANRKSLTDYPDIPYPRNYVTAELGNRLIYDELKYDAQQQKVEFNQLFKSLTGTFHNSGV